MINWKEEYNLGIVQIDEQHKMLFDIAGRAYKLLTDEMKVDKYDEIVAVLEELKDYTKFHFSFEEEYMMKIGYKKLLSHKVQHSDFIEKMDSIDLNKVDEDQDKYLGSITDYIINWIIGHILGRDRDYAGLGAL